MKKPSTTSLLLIQLPGLRTLRIVVWAIILSSGVWGAVFSDYTVAQSNGESHIYSVDIDSTINPGTVGIVKHAIQAAERDKVQALILNINTPGGLLSSTRDMVSLISESKVPVIGYVTPSGANAGSAGAFILLATDIAVMHSGTNIGASSPVSETGADIEGTMGKKIMNDSKAFMRSIAESRERNIAVAESFVSEAHSLTAREALDQGVINYLVKDQSTLLATIDGHEINFRGQTRKINSSDVEVKALESRLIDQLLVYIAHPQIAHMLISLGTLAIYIEIISPGLAFPGILGVIAVILGLVSIQTLPVNIGFLLLLLLGLILMASEYFIAGFGILGVGGAVAFILGSLYLFDGATGKDYDSGILSISIAISASMILMTYLITRSIFSGPRKQNVKGKTGEAMMSFEEQGFVLIEGKRWAAVTQNPLQYGEKIRVVDQNTDGQLVVIKLSEMV